MKKLKEGKYFASSLLQVGKPGFWSFPSDSRAGLLTHLEIDCLILGYKHMYSIVYFYKLAPEFSSLF